MRCSFGLYLLLLALAAGAQTPDGRKIFETRCSICHGLDGNGGEFAGSIVARLRAMNDTQIESTISAGVPGRGMPPVAAADDELRVLLAHLRTLRAPGPGSREAIRQITTTTGAVLQGVVTGEGIEDLQVRTTDGRIHLMRRSGERFREVTSQKDWPAYDGGFNGNRFTTQQQIDKSNVSRLVPRWIFA